jgi:hypothetical protein
MRQAAKNKSIRGEFHIHVDVHEMAGQFESFLHQLKFSNTDFSGHPDGALHFETPKHLTYKTKDITAFRSTFDAIVAELETAPHLLEGYVEGEYLPIDLDIEAMPFDPEVKIPCQWDLGVLAPGTFREDELHITLDKDRSDPRLIQDLRSMGFFSAYMEKPYGTAQILTVQGTRRTIKTLLASLIPYLKNAGGSVRCSIKEEQVIRWWASSNSVKFPPVAQSVTVL